VKKLNYIEPMIVKIVGDVSNFNIDKLQCFGKITMVKESDLFVH